MVQTLAHIIEVALIRNGPPQTVVTEVSVGWSRNGQLNRWCWFPVEDCSTIRAMVDLGNKKHGAGSHWLEER